MSAVASKMILRDRRLTQTPRTVVETLEADEREVVREFGERSVEKDVILMAAHLVVAAHFP